ncbi:hypothetical protein [Streptomyces albidoflavus]|uniref:hypothetical protein n=1 Tax=Streptomyces albidoflavus TaxID=1886 RepID=UPI0033262C81
MGRVGHWQRGSGRGRPAAGRHRHPHPAHRRPRSPDAAERLAAAADLWRAALAAGLPSGALAGAGAFADTGLDEDLWLSLTRASAEHTPALTNATSSPNAPPATPTARTHSS